MNFVPVVVEKELGSEKSYDIFSRLLKDRIVFITGEIDDVMANNVIAELLYLDSINNNDINIYINSPGGSVSAVWQFMILLISWQVMYQLLAWGLRLVWRPFF